MTSPGRNGWPPDSFVGMLPEAERTALLTAGQQARFADDQVLVFQGDAGDCLYVLTTGMVKVIVSVPTGAEAALGLRSRGDLVGEFAMVDNKPRTATARAAGQVAAVRISRVAWTALTEEHPAIASALTTYILGKMRASTERRVAERVWEARQRLAQVLYKLAEEYGVPESDGALRVPFTQSELGQFAGVAVSTAERLLTEFRKRGVIATAYRAVVVRDMVYLGSIRFSDEGKSTPLPDGM